MELKEYVLIFDKNRVKQVHNHDLAFFYHVVTSVMTGGIAKTLTKGCGERFKAFIEYLSTEFNIHFLVPFFSKTFISRRGIGTMLYTFRMRHFKDLLNELSCVSSTIYDLLSGKRTTFLSKT